MSNRLQARLMAKPGEFLTDEWIRQIAPSVFARSAHDSRSDRFAVIPTGTVLKALRKEGFGVTQVAQTRTRDASRRGFTKHMLRLRRIDARPARDRRIGDVYPEAVLVNANDGSSRYRLSAGLFRLICLNGAVVEDASLGGVSVGHIGEITDTVIEGTYTVIKEARRALHHAEAWAAIELPRRAAERFADRALALRFPHGEPPIEADQLLGVRRPGDAGNDLWSVFNRVQENALRGGLAGERRDGARRVVTREIRGIDQDLRLNRQLWQLAEETAERMR